MEAINSKDQETLTKLLFGNRIRINNSIDEVDTMLFINRTTTPPLGMQQDKAGDGERKNYLRLAQTYSTRTKYLAFLDCRMAGRLYTGRLSTDMLDA